MWHWWNIAIRPAFDRFRTLPNAKGELYGIDRKDNEICQHHEG